MIFLCRKYLYEGVITKYTVNLVHVVLFEQVAIQMLSIKYMYNVYYRKVDLIKFREQLNQYSGEVSICHEDHLYPLTYPEPVSGLEQFSLNYWTNVAFLK